MAKRPTARPGRGPGAGASGGLAPLRRRPDGRARRDWRAGLNWRAANARERDRASGGYSVLASAVRPNISGRAGFGY